eukprot:TRINITY_DN1173_c0_g1_i3.p1 TRINITY_DN1173_c0_g1~~TRINITY_DN1173_c0_g1_i3.p1  ORF type:complete len:166 (+),score=23.40 TRINITY_DN1173_c0_g1_i3:227-724(+)
MVLIFSIFHNASMGIADATFTKKYWDVLTCSDGTIILPTHWILGDSIINLFNTAVFVPLAFYLKKTGNPDVILNAWIPFIMAAITCGWGLLGSVIVWKQNVDCQPEKFQHMLYTSVVMSAFVGFFKLLFTGCTLNSKIKQAEAQKLKDEEEAKSKTETNGADAKN